jgi:hypothetical protein
LSDKQKGPPPIDALLFEKPEPKVKSEKPKSEKPKPDKPDKKRKVETGVETVSKKPKN